jgi:predicted ribosomally synthesized peptide with SipW-like signal peptide
MKGIWWRLVRMASWRTLLVMALTMGVLGMQTGRGTLAYFTDSKTSSGNTFTAGILSLQASTLPPATFKWDTSTTNANCGSLTNVAGNYAASAAQLGQPLTPGDFCVAYLTLDPGTTNVDFRYHVRLLRQTASGVALNDALNNALQIAMKADTAANCTIAAAGDDTYFAGGTIATPTSIGSVISGGGADITNGNAFIAQPANSFWDLVGNANLDSAGTPAVISAPFTPVTYCVRISWPLGAVTVGNNAQNGSNIYAFQLAAAQLANR